MKALLTFAATEKLGPQAQAAPLARLGGIAMTLALGAMTLPHLPLFMALILCLFLGLVVGVPLAANSAVKRGHDLKTMTPANPLHWLKRGGIIRVLLCGFLGICAAGILLVRLSEGGLAAWIGAAAGGAAVLAVMHSGGRTSARINAPVHDAAKLRRAALHVGIATTAVASGLTSLLHSPSDPAIDRYVASALVAEAFEAHRFLEGVLAWAVSTVAALNILPPLTEAVLAALVLAMSGAAVAGLAVAALMPAEDWVRAVAIASDTPDAPGPHRPAMLAAAIVTGLAVVGASWTESWLSARDPAVRPVAQLQTGVERIGVNFYLLGTYARVNAGREALVARDKAALAEIRGLADAAFDAMANEVDQFLDGYYSLRAEYWRIGVAARGFVQGDAEAAMQTHLATRLAVALDSETHLGAITDRLSSLALAVEHAAHEVQEKTMSDIQVNGLNPARLRLVAEYPTFAPQPQLQTLGLTSKLEARLGGSVVGGVLGAVVARRVVEKLLQSGVLRMSARALLTAVPLLGSVIALGTDAAVLKLEEHFNRADFRTEILDALEDQRAAVLQVLDGAADF